MVGNFVLCCIYLYQIQKIKCRFKLFETKHPSPPPPPGSENLFLQFFGLFCFISTQIIYIEQIILIFNF